MSRVDDIHFHVILPLCEVGHFEVKAFFVPEGSQDPVWVPGANTVINVEPADTCCGNIIYNAFVRQFGPNKSGRFSSSAHSSLMEKLDKDGCVVIPPSGTFRDLIKELDFIVNRLGCRIIQLLPIYTAPTTYGRLGRFGSPYAALSFTAVDPALAEFDPKATPLEQFIELVDEVHSRNTKIFIDIAINHTGWAASLHETNPQWLVRDSEGQIEVPGAWGVRWEDLTKLDYEHKNLWQYMAGVFLTWCRRGVDGFRCDAGYMIPVQAWKYIIARVRGQFPDTIFFLEGLGGKVSVTRDLLNIANFNWAYSELFQNYDRQQIENYLPGAIEISKKDGVMLHFAETHDNPRLASRSLIYAKMRTALCALSSHQGAFGFANGVEWYAPEKINVHESPSINWGASPNQINEIYRLNTILKTHPAFFDQTQLRFIQRTSGNFIVLLRHHLPTGKKLLLVANLDDQHQNFAKWDPLEAKMEGTRLWDLLTEKEATLFSSDNLNSMELQQGEVCCLTADRKDIGLIRKGVSPSTSLLPRISEQCIRAKALDVFRFYRGTSDLKGFNLNEAIWHLERDPVEFCRQQNPYSQEPHVISWNWPRDLKREVMVPPDHFLMIRAENAFRARIMKQDRVYGSEASLKGPDGTHFALFCPLSTPKAHTPYTLQLSVYSTRGCIHADAPLLFLTRAEDMRIKRVYGRKELLTNSFCLLETNERGGMLKLPVKWGELHTRYDALLAANCHPDFPVDRWIMFTRCRAWVVLQDYSREINIDCFDKFILDDELKGTWRFRVPTGQGRYIKLIIKLEIMSGENSTRIAISRLSTDSEKFGLADHKPVQIILRPDIENRNAHYSTKAYKGPEHQWPKAVTVLRDGFIFKPEVEHGLQIKISKGTYVHEPEWHYMVYRPKEAERGLDPDSDLFSPGYFSGYIKGNQDIFLAAKMLPPDFNRLFHKAHKASHKKTKDRHVPVEEKFFSNSFEALKASVNHYIVKRGELKTVVAGYPWFLDWGRDSLIFSRGLIAAKYFRSAREIIKQFGRFEKDGTLPNMIQGNNAQNRDTSDAPLWLFVACNDLIAQEGNDLFLDEPIGDRTLRQILISTGHSLLSGTPNGIRVDAGSGLLYSPAHFTWMDTNYPAGTPREGYPIEIQALWFSALQLLARIDTETSAGDWQKLAKKMTSSILDLFFLNKCGYLSDCLHAHQGMSAFRAEPDNALRPNQLIALTLGAVQDDEVCRKILSSCEELLVPGAIRSLSDRPVSRRLEIVYNGKFITDPNRPYQGRYYGDEDSQRKPAYHNGTAWTWLLPAYCEAWAKVYGKKAKNTAMAWLASASRLINQGCIGHVPEILDGDFPHNQRGCGAQAWGISELLRVWVYLTQL